MFNPRVFEDGESYYGDNIYNHKRGQVNIPRDNTYKNHRHGQDSLNPRNYQYTNGISSKNRVNEYSDFHDQPVRQNTNVLDSRYMVDGRKGTFYQTPSRNYSSNDFYRNDSSKTKPPNFSREVHNEYKKRRYETLDRNIEKIVRPIDYRLLDHRFQQRRFSDSTYDRHHGRDTRQDIYFENYAPYSPEPNRKIQSFDAYNRPDYLNQPDHKKVHYDIDSNKNSFYKDIDHSEKSVTNANVRNKSKLYIIVFNNIFLLGGLATGLASCIKAPWWSKSDGNGNQWLSIGLWEACKKTQADTIWECHKYSIASYESPFKSIRLLQACMIASVASSGAAVLIMCVVGFLITKHPKITRLLIYIAGVLILEAAILFGLTIAYAVDNKNPANLVPVWVEFVSGSLDHAIMFYVSCAAAACLFLALIHVVVLLFINDDYDTDQIETQSVDENPIKYQYDNPQFDNKYNGLNPVDGEIKQQFELLELPNSPKLPKNHKQNKQSLTKPEELSGVNPKYLVHNGKTRQFKDRYAGVNEGYNHNVNEGYNHSLKGVNERYEVNDGNERYNQSLRNVNERYNRSVKDVNEGYIQEQNSKISVVKKKHSLPNILKENYDADNYPRHYLTNSVPTPAVYMYTNKDKDFKNNVTYNKNIASPPSVDYETYFNSPY